MNSLHRDSAVGALPALPDLPTVSIITPSYNTGKFIEQALRSVQLQDYPFVEHIVLDSGSTDETAEILARHPSIQLVSPAPQGMCEKVNHGLAIAKGDIVAYLCADDYFLPGAISKAVAALKANPSVAMVYCNNIVVDDRGVETSRERARQARVEDFFERDQVPQQTAFFRPQAAKSVGGLDPRYYLVSDWDLWIRMSKAFPILYVDDWWGVMRVHQGQLSSKHKYEKWKQARGMAREKYGGPFFSPMLWNYWRAKIERAAVMLSNGEFRLFLAKLHGNARGLMTARHHDR